MGKPTPYDIKFSYEHHNPNGKFFTRESMKFFGDTMRNYGVRDAGEYWELYRKIPVKHRQQASHYFHKETFKHTSQMTYDRSREEFLRVEFKAWQDLTIENSDPINGGLGRLRPEDVTIEMWATVSELGEELAFLIPQRIQRPLGR